MYFMIEGAVNTDSCIYNSDYIASAKIRQPMFKHYECFLMTETESFQLCPQ
jgi:hypothetical protein